MDIRIELDRPSGPYYPGDVVQATIALQSEKEMKVRKASAGLVLLEDYEYTYAKAKGGHHHGSDTVEDFRSFKDLLEGGAIPAGVQTYHLDCKIPANAPAPYRGQITKNRWLVRASLDRERAIDIHREVELPLVVPPPGKSIEPGEYGETEHSDEAELRFWLPRLEWVEGETVEGKLLVRPTANFGVSEVRLELLRQEYVPRNDGHTHIFTEGEVKLADKVEFWPAHHVEYSFAFPLPKQGCPTRRTDHSRVTWSLKATLARRLRKDAIVSVEVYVYNGPAPA